MADIEMKFEIDASGIAAFTKLIAAAVAAGAKFGVFDAEKHIELVVMPGKASVHALPSVAALEWFAAGLKGIVK